MSHLVTLGPVGSPQAASAAFPAAISGGSGQPFTAGHASDRRPWTQPVSTGLPWLHPRRIRRMGSKQNDGGLDGRPPTERAAQHTRPSPSESTCRSHRGRIPSANRQRFPTRRFATADDRSSMDVGSIAGPMRPFEPSAFDRRAGQDAEFEQPWEDEKNRRSPNAPPRHGHSRSNPTAPLQAVTSKRHPRRDILLHLNNCEGKCLATKKCARLGGLGTGWGAINASHT